MSITTLDQTLFYRDWMLFRVFADDAGTSTIRDTDNLGDGRTRITLDIAGVWDVDRVVLVTRQVPDDVIIESARFFRDGVRLASVTAIELSLDVTDVRPLAGLYSGDDLITGSTWNNALRGYGGRDTIRGGWGDDRLAGNAGRDWLNGQAGDDTLHGGRGDDLVVGGNGNDQLFGGAGFDRIGGNGGRDTMTGGDTADLFVFRQGDGRRDVITDYDPTEDRFLIPVGAESFGEIRLRVSGEDVLLEFADVRVRLTGAADQIGEIKAGDFLFE